MEPETTAKKSIGQIMKSNISLRSENMFVKYLSLILIVLVVGEIAGFLLCQSLSSRESAPSFQGTNIVPKKKATETSASAQQRLQNQDKNIQDKTVSDDDANVNIIKKYYELLSAGKLQEAYAMRAVQDVSFKEFSGWYNNVEYAKPDNFKSIGDNAYDFMVNYKDKDTDAKKYGVRMTVADGKVKTASSKEFKSVETKFGDYTAFSVLRGDKIYLIMEKGGVENIIDVADYSTKALSEGFNESFINLKFSPKGNYLLYSIEGYESIDTLVYDIKNKKIVNGVSFAGVAAGNGIDFVPSEKYLYYCLGNGFYAGVPGEVYSIPGFNAVFRAMDEGGYYMDSSCGYDQKENAIVFNLSEPFSEDNSLPQTKVVKFSVGK
jgi:hypothetical protein